MRNVLIALATMIVVAAGVFLIDGAVRTYHYADSGTERGLMIVALAILLHGLTPRKF